MIEEHWGLRHSPFSLNPDARFLFESAAHREGLARLLFAARELRGGITLLTGDIGCGKTTLIRTFLRLLPRKSYRTAFLVHPTLPVGQLLASILREFGAKRVRGGKSEQVAALHTLLFGLHDQGLSSILLVDEAQLLDRPRLEELRLLTNLETSKEKLLHLILIGQPELSRQVSRFPELAQRIVMRSHLRPLSLDETSSYLGHRLRVAGASRPIFTSDAVSGIYHHTGGVPRLLNLVASHALFLAAAANRAQVDEAAVAAASRELDLIQGPSSAPAVPVPAAPPQPAAVTQN
jgi:general secretion pathway protein A